MSSPIVSANCALSALVAFKMVLNEILHCCVFDGEALSALMAPLVLGWNDRARHKLSLREQLTSVLERLAQRREIKRLSAHEQ
ncbi:hypothetical protein [Xanthomonas arboricola]|uniref:hypothetical protein n=1 Tax=Xanthomonas arboricola TaxID=56448 RepID=UPI00162026F1|nr:hypothetical protein [Xanthomonas arboricola]MBB4726937.1 hypothetical protein [Xanthomonas arboricola]